MKKSSKDKRRRPTSGKRHNAQDLVLVTIRMSREQRDKLHEIAEADKVTLEGYLRTLLGICNCKICRGKPVL